MAHVCHTKYIKQVSANTMPRITTGEESTVMVEDIYTKLHKFQKLGLTLKKTGHNPHYDSHYVPLAEVLEVVTQPLNDLGILLLQLPQETGLKCILRSVDDGSQVEGFLPYVEIGTVQRLVSNNSYNRRVITVTMLGMKDVDDDGNAASSLPEKPAPATPIPDGSHSVTVIQERHGSKDGRDWQKVVTDLGTAWNNDKDALVMETGITYDVVVGKNSILQARIKE